jgi:SAM-dependent methyltransferase
VKSKVAAVFEAETPEVLAERYDELAPSYDDALDTDISPRRAADVLARHCPGDGRILDAGCGTGRVGQVLRELGYHDLAGIDISQGMLEEARKKGCYVGLHQQDLGQALGYSEDTFDAVISVGVFVRGHAPSSSLDELVRVTKPGGHIVFTLRPEFYLGSDFKDKLASLAIDGRWRLVETGDQFIAGFKEFPDINLEVWVYEVLPPS